MNWLNIHTDILRSEAYLGADPIERATWLSLLGWCATQENGGLIEDAADWKDRKWQQVCGITKDEVDLKSELYAFENKNLVVSYYPTESETAVLAKREAGKKGGRPKKTAIEKETKPSGSKTDNHVDKVTKREALTKGKERECKVKVKVKKEEPAATLPFVSESFKESWQEWVCYLKEKRKTPTKMTIKKQLNQLSKINEKDAIITINNSIQNGWQGLFPLERTELGQTNKSSGRKGTSAGDFTNLPLL